MMSTLKCFLLYFALIIAAILFYIKIINSSSMVMRQQSIWRMECELGVIKDEKCPVDGGWDSWGTWSSCHGSCDDIGHRRRTRHCSNPPPSNDGLSCNGDDEDIQPCYLSNCTVESFRNIITGDTAREQAFHLLEAVPAMMERCLQVECPFEAIEAALSSDNTWQLDSESLWNSLQCVKLNLGCSVPGEWGPWGSWSACSARCGAGMRWRLRRCDSPLPSDDHLLCEGSPLLAQACRGHQCAMGLLNGDDTGGSKWSAWSHWTNCSEKCGVGVRRRRRVCHEKTKPSAVDMWGTHCVGQHDQIEVCKNRKCVLDGGWSGWSAWGPCSQTCGAGRRSRTRTCTRPSPSGGGKSCPGQRTEVASCYLSPCEAYSHSIVIMNGDSNLQYNLRNKRAALFHFYVRFLAQAPHGTLVRRVRSTNDDQFVRLTLQNWHLCLDASGRRPYCTLPRICSPFKLDSDVWHTALITVSNADMTLRINDDRMPLRATFICDPDYEDESMNIIVGEKLHGAIQELALNFIPLSIFIDSDLRNTRSDFVPSSAVNIVLSKGSVDEAFLPISDGEFMRLPCTEKDNWRLEFTVKPKRESGTLVFMGDSSLDNWLHVYLQNNRLKVKMVIGDFKSESTSFTEYPTNQWVDIKILKKKAADLIEAHINSDERIHMILDDVIARRHRIVKQSKKHLHLIPVEGDHSLRDEVLCLCHDEYYFGGLPKKLKYNLEEDFTPFSGTLASLSTDDGLQDLYKFHVERDQDGLVQLSSKTASISGSYHEIGWGSAKRLNLTCLHARSSRSPHTAQWLLLDTSLAGVLAHKHARSVDDGRVLRLIASADKHDLRGFYTCRAHNNRMTRNIVTYGVIGKLKSRIIGPDTITVIAIITTLTLVISTLGWLFLEGSRDIKDGFGFFRDAQLTPKEEAEAVCKFIDENMDCYASKSVAELAKEKARWKGQEVADRLSFEAHEFKQTQKSCNDYFSSEPDLPALPEIKSYAVSPKYNRYRSEPSYVSSPQHGSLNTSPRTKLSSSSLEMSSPTLLCSRLLVMRRMHSSETLSPRLKKPTINKSLRPKPKTISKLPTIRSSSYINKSLAHKVLQKFQQLKADDI